jgi:formamidopyrimidine-DNA glycosylase
VKKALLKAKVTACKRKGKYLWLELNKKPWPIFHLGMSGSYVLTKELPKKLGISVKLVLQASNGAYLIFRDPRRFGRVFLVRDPSKEKPLNSLNHDVLTNPPSTKEVMEIFKGRKAPIKALLLDQNLFAGIGNWMADEILFQSGLSPKRKALEVTHAEAARIAAKIKSVTKLAVKVGADDEKYPKTWIFHHRWGKKGEAVSTGDEIKYETVAGRTTAWVPSKQR